MIYIFSKNKIFSYIVAFSVVTMLFAFSTTIIPDNNIELIKISANVTNDLQYKNNIQNIE